MSPLGRYFPITRWLPAYRRDWLRTDVLAGLTVVALLIPEGMAYAEIAGMPPQTAFYAAPVGLLLYAIFGTSKQLIVAVSAAIATMSYATISGIATPGTPEFYVLTSALAVLAGFVAILAGLLKMGRIAQFFSESVMAGFVTGLALTIAIKQVPKMLGFEGGSGNFWERLTHIFQHLSETHLATLIVAGLCLALMIVLERYFHQVPAALAALLFGIAISTLFNLSAHGVHVIGEIPSGFVLPKLPGIPLQAWLVLIPGAVGLALVNFAEGIGPARSFAASHKYNVDANQELVGLGAANLGAGLFQAFPIGSSLSKSAANDRSGAHSQMSALVAAGLTVLVALFLTPLFYNLPEATLGAIVIVAVAAMMKFAKIRSFYALRRVDFWLAVVAMMGVLTFEALEGLLLAVIVSLLALVARASQPKLAVMGREPGRLEFSDLRRNPENKAIPGLIILRPDESIFFANAASLREEILQVVSATEPRPSHLLLDLELCTDPDIPAADMFLQLHEELEGMGIRLGLCRLHAETRAMLERSGVLGEIGAANTYPRAISAVLAYLAAREQWDDLRALVRDVLGGALEIIRSGEESHADTSLAADIEKLLDESARKLEGS